MDTNLLLLATFVVAVVITSLTAAVITNQQKVTQVKLQQSHDKLETRVQERTIELVKINNHLQTEIEERKRIEIDLADARDQALEALSLKNQIFTNVSHDARTPLNIITLHTELLGHHAQIQSSEKLQKYIQTILQSARELLEFINNLLDEAHLQTRLAAPEKRPLNLHNWLGSSVAPFENMAQEKDLSLVYHVPSDFPEHIMIDEHWLKQIISNLVQNAVKFTTTGSITVKACTLSPNEWSISVSDTGSGIPEIYHNKIFDAFWQLDGSLTRAHSRGVGIGLSIVKQRVHLMNGRLDLQSSPEQGSTFTIIFPATEISS